MPSPRPSQGYGMVKRMHLSTGPDFLPRRRLALGGRALHRLRFLVEHRLHLLSLGVGVLLDVPLLHAGLFHLVRDRLVLAHFLLRRLGSKRGPGDGGCKDDQKGAHPVFHRSVTTAILRARKYGSTTCVCLTVTSTTE